MHAYCIMAHNNFAQLQELINLLDDSRNVIFLHVDKKVYHDYITFGGITSQSSKIHICEPQDVRWADVSQSRTEVMLFKMVVESDILFDRVHLISGSDLPIKNQDYIHNFFNQYSNVEFLSFGPNPQTFEKRLKYYHFFTKHVRHNKFAQLGRRIILLFQYPFVNRMKNNPYKFLYGPNWCSLTLKAIKMIVEEWEKYSNHFRFSTSSDECYKQMILSCDKSFTFSPKGNLRYVVWEGKSSPRCLQSSDFKNLLNSNCLFARKFDMSFNKEIVDLVIKNLN